MPSKLKRNIAAIGFLIFVVIVCVVMLAIVLTAKREDPGTKKKLSPTASSLHHFTKQDWYTRKYSPHYASVRWISDTEFVTTNKNITVTSLQTNKSEVLVPYDVLRRPSAYWLSFSADRQWALLQKNYSKMYRHSSLAHYMAYHIPSGAKVRLDPPDPNNKIQLVMWGNKGNKLAFVQNNNIYYKACANCTTHTITSNGETNKIYNGVPDWVYEEDVYGKNVAMWFSPDDRYLGYGQFNDTQVTWFSYMHYGAYKDPYTTVRKIAYPKPGTANPTAKAMLVDLQALPGNLTEIPMTRDFEPPPEFRDIDHYFTGMDWADNERVIVGWANRVQNVTIIMICNATSSTCQENHRQQARDGWVPTESYMRKRWYSKDRTYFLTLFPFEQGEDGKFLHLGMITLPASGPGDITNLTHGTWEVTSIVAFDTEKEIVYVSAAKTSPRELHLYSVHVKTKVLTCLSCPLPWAKSGRCKYFVPSFSPGASWYSLVCYGPGIPVSSRHSTNNSQVTILESNTELEEKIKGLKRPKTRNFRFTSGAYEIEAQEILPPNFDETKKYAVLFDVYGGPGSQKVVEIYSFGFNEYLVSNFDIIVVKLDARGTRRRGERFKHEVYLKLGEYEAEDTINAGRYMQTKPYVDKNKLSIWGWSYGGYLTTYVLSKNTGVIKVGMAVAPVVDWYYYDTAYTERYMRLPQDNPDGYKSTSLLTRAKNFTNASYLLIHGSGDDNVHYQNAAQMVKALTNANIQFRVQYYTDKAHSIRGVYDHLYTLLTTFLTTKLGIAA